MWGGWNTEQKILTLKSNRAGLVSFTAYTSWFGQVAQYPWDYLLSSIKWEQWYLLYWNFLKSKNYFILLCLIHSEHSINDSHYSFAWTNLGFHHSIIQDMPLYSYQTSHCLPLCVRLWTPRRKFSDELITGPAFKGGKHINSKWSAVINTLKAQHLFKYLECQLYSKPRFDFKQTNKKLF